MLKVLLVTLIGTGIPRQLARKTFACIWFTASGALLVAGLYLYVT